MGVVVASLLCGDSAEVLASVASNSVDSIVTDAPYGLGKDPDAVALLLAWLAEFAGESERADAEHLAGLLGRGFMGKDWDTVPHLRVWKECFRVLKPGGHLMTFAGSRTADLLSFPLRLAGFEIRDTLTWHYGQGFPKSMDVGKAIDKAGGNPLAHRVFARYLRAALDERGVTAADVDRHLGIAASACYWLRDDHRGGLCPRHHWNTLRAWLGLPAELDDLYHEAVRADRKVAAPGGNSVFQPVRAVINPGTPATEAAAAWDGWGTALKPASEPIILARKPLSERTVAANVLAHGTGALNINATRIATTSGDEVSNHARGPEAAQSKGAFGDSAAQETHQTSGQALGRWPANVLLSHHPECVEIGKIERGKGAPVVSSGGKSGDSAWTHRGGSYGAGAVNVGVRSYGVETVPVYECTPGCPVALLDAQSGPAGAAAPVAVGKPRGHQGVYGAPNAQASYAQHDGVNGGAARFYYTSKANNRERWGWCHDCGAAWCRGDRASKAAHKGHNTEWHPTVKPVDLMRWLVRLVTPPGGIVLDPFAGTGTTGEAAIREGFRALLIDQSPLYSAIIEARLRDLVDALGAAR